MLPFELLSPTAFCNNGRSLHIRLSIHFSREKREAKKKLMLNYYFWREKKREKRVCSPQQWQWTRSDLSCIYSVLHFLIRLPFTPDLSCTARWPHNLFLSSLGLKNLFWAPMLELKDLLFEKLFLRCFISASQKRSLTLSRDGHTVHFRLSTSGWTLIRHILLRG